jgi:hypothetical protein
MKQRDRHVRGVASGPALVGPIYVYEAGLGEARTRTSKDGWQVLVSQLWCRRNTRQHPSPSTTTLPSGNVQRG